MHRIAFATRSAQVGLSDLEDKLYRKPLAQLPMGPPVFVAGLPRAGTTLLLEMLEQSPEFVTHTYQDMPFVLTPILWSKMAASFRKEADWVERAHGDGMLVSVESPEAFEEVIWAKFWQQQYLDDQVKPWDARLKFAEFETFFRQHMAKIALLRGSTATANQVDATPWRYLSKNNMNIARLAYLAKVFPQAKIVIPFREPIQHSRSLLRQHRNFLDMHQQDPFARDYMRAIGHYDFGENLKPINFDQWLPTSYVDATTEEGFWLDYWIAAYRNIAASLPANARLFSYDRFCQNPLHSLQLLREFLGVNTTELKAETVARIKPPAKHSGVEGQSSNAQLIQAQQLYDSLSQIAVNGG